MDEATHQTSYFNYFTEIEDHFRQCRGTTLLLSTLDWVLMDVWKQAGVPLEAVLRGIDVTFARFAERRSKNRKVNGLGFCTQEVLAAAEEMKQAAVGAGKLARDDPGESAFPVSEIVRFLRQNAEALEGAQLPETKELSPRPLAKETAKTLRAMAGQLEEGALPALEDLERRLTVAEEKLLAVLLAVIPDDEIVAARAEADHALAPYARKMPAAQIEQLQKQYVRKRFLDQYGLPRLSLFYL